jgi:hypothetical protein
VKTVFSFGEVWGIGPATILKLYDKGHRTLNGLRNDDSLTNAQKLGLRHFDDIRHRILRHEVCLVVPFIHCYFPKTYSFYFTLNWCSFDLIDYRDGTDYVESWGGCFAWGEHYKILGKTTFSIFYILFFFSTREGINYYQLKGHYWPFSSHPWVDLNSVP